MESVRCSRCFSISWTHNSGQSGCNGAALIRAKQLFQTYAGIIRGLRFSIVETGSAKIRLDRSSLSFLPFRRKNSLKKKKKKEKFRLLCLRPTNLDRAYAEMRIVDKFVVSKE